MLQVVEGKSRYNAPSYETVRPWVKAIKNGREETGDAPHGGAPTSATDERQVKSVLEHMHSISCTATVTEVGISPVSVYHILTNSLVKQKFMQVDSTHA